jgi:hypothetical protein
MPRLVVSLLLLASAHGFTALVAAPVLETRGDSVAWQTSEWTLRGLPEVSNPFDPDEMAVDLVVRAPDGGERRIPAFWFQAFERSLVEGVQQLAPEGVPEWRVRFTPTDHGMHEAALVVSRRGFVDTTSPLLRFEVAPASKPFHGWSRVSADGRTLVTSDGAPLLLVGANVCWGGARATYDYDEWLPALRAHGGNFARLWLAPWSMGIEHQPGTLNRYDLGEAWELDHVFDLAAAHGIHLVLAMDHHGMFMANDPAWGGSNNFWTRASPYAVENGGPCVSPNAFFTSPQAVSLYRKRLRYLIARYGASPWLLSWQFFNEIDNAYLPRSDLVHADVLAWHRDTARWLRAADPYDHLISTSLTGASDRPDYWTMPEMDFTVYHSYGEADPALHVARLAADFVERYGKPTMIGEIGTNAGSWRIADDPYLRGCRQGLWAGLLGGSVGTSMPWWWEDIHTDHVYPLFGVVSEVVRTMRWDEHAWHPIRFARAGSPPPRLGNVEDDGAPFDVDLALNRLRLNPVDGSAAIPSILAAERAAERLSAYLHGRRQPHLQQHARVEAWFANGARLVVGIDSTAANARLRVLVDGEEVHAFDVVDKDGMGVPNREIDAEFTVSIPSGRRTIEVGHDGGDWVLLSRLRLERARPSTFDGGWEFGADAIGLRADDRAVLYVRSPHVAWPAGALRFNPPLLDGESVTVESWPAGGWAVRWIDSREGRVVHEQPLAHAGGPLTLSLPNFREDLVGLLMPDDPAASETQASRR